METQWLPSKGLQVPRRGREGGEDLVLEGAPLKGLLGEETWEERGRHPPSLLLGRCLCSAHWCGGSQPGMLPSAWPCPPFPPRASGPHLASIRKSAAGGQGWCEDWREPRGQPQGEAFWEHLLLRSFLTREACCWGGVEVRKGCAAFCPVAVPHSLEAGWGGLGRPPSTVCFGPCLWRPELGTGATWAAPSCSYPLL